MKNINQYITEKFKLSSRNTSKQYNYHPKDKDELKKLVDKLIKERGNEADLNDIDTSEITNMVFLFLNSKFNGDISNWDVSNVTNMTSMFKYSKFNGDISNWDIRNVKYTLSMFKYSKFNGDISNWDVSNIEDMDGMFDNCPLEKNPPKWYKK